MSIHNDNDDMISYGYDSCPDSNQIIRRGEFCHWIAKLLLMGENPTIKPIGMVSTPIKLTWNTINEGLEDNFPFQLGDFRFHVNLPGCI